MQAVRGAPPPALAFVDVAPPVAGGMSDGQLELAGREARSEHARQGPLLADCWLERLVLSAAEPAGRGALLRSSRGHALAEGDKRSPRGSKGCPASGLLPLHAQRALSALIAGLRRIPAQPGPRRQSSKGFL